MEYGEYARQQVEWYTHQTAWWKDRAEYYKKEIQENTAWIKEMRKEYGKDWPPLIDAEKRRKAKYKLVRQCERTARHQAEQAERFRKEAEAWASRK